MMPMVGAFMGGKGSTIAAGYGMADLTWVTSDGQNMEGATITLTGPKTYTFSTDSNGRVQETIEVGEYIATVTHGGKYGGDGAKTIIIKNREVTSAIWFAQKKTGYTIVFTSPSGYSSITYSISNESGVVYSGDAWTTNMSFILDDFESYTLSLTIFGDTLTHDFIVNGNMTIDLSGHFCQLIASNSAGLAVESITYNGYSASSSNTVYVVKTNESRVVKCGCGSKYSGRSTSPVATFNDETVVPSSDSINLSLTAVGVVVTITSSGSLQVPISGTYHTLVIGGGGGGVDGKYSSPRMYGGGGGGGGDVADSNLNLTAGSFTITIGSGGSAGSAGSASSFGTKLSASGGGVGTNGAGGAGGSGGGGGGAYQGAPGGAASYGGGGGGGAIASNGKKNGGTGGTYGGAGGSSVNYDDTSDYTPAGSGVTTNEEFYGGKLYGNGGSPGSNYRAGGGGGGGRGAAGGRGGNGYDTAGASAGEAGGGGGGGGVAGGSGGEGGAYSPSSSQINPGYGGYGYGAGGGGGGYYDNASYRYKLGGGGGGGGLSSTKVSSNGSGSSGGAGAKGAVRIQWVGA